MLLTLILTLREEKRIVDSTPGVKTCKKKKKIEARVRFTLIRKGGGEDNYTAPVDESIGIHVHVYSHYHTTGQLSLYVE